MPTSTKPHRLFPKADPSYARRRLEAFLPKVGRYAADRNYDRPGHPAVSLLSPYLQRHLLSEEEVCHAVLEQYSWESAEKFLQEVCWRTYWKGWLEMRPGIWASYRERLARDEPPELAKNIARAEEGATGIDCFDHWVRELKETNYLHNHVRMWFASLWIFTLKLPWERGADFFFRHLMDADPASNTLGWRWVGGWQTPGKTYLARSSNITRYTEGRWSPEDALLATEAPAPALSREELRPTQPLSWDEFPPSLGEKTGLLVFGDDLNPLSTPLREVSPEAIGLLTDEAFAPSYHLAPLVRHFHHQATTDAQSRLQEHWQKPVDLLKDHAASPETVNHWIQSRGLTHLLLLRPTVGPWRDRWTVLRQSLPPEITLTETARPWDQALWPHATAGFFRFKKPLPTLVRDLCSRHHPSPA